MKSLVGKVVLVTGAGRNNGQGAAEAKYLADAGAIVFITDVLGEEGEATAKALGNSVSYLHLDVTSEENWAGVVATISDKHGRIDGLVNNAGVWSGTGILDTSVEEFKRVMEINQVGVFMGIKAVALLMKSNGGGSIVNTGSAASLRVGVYYWHNSMTAHAYTVSKWAVHGITKAAAMEFAPDNIRVNSIHPGPIDTAMLGNSDREKLAADVPMKRLGQPEDIAGTVGFLLSDECSYMTGSELAIDGAATV